MSSGVSLCMVTCGVVVMAANIWLFSLGDLFSSWPLCWVWMTARQGPGEVALAGVWLHLLGKVVPLWEELWEALLEPFGLLSQFLLRGVFAAFHQVLSYWLLTGLTYISWGHLVSYFFGLEDLVSFGFIFTGLQLLGNCIQCKEGLSILAYLIPEFLVGWFDSLQQPL